MKRLITILSAVMLLTACAPIGTPQDNTLGDSNSTIDTSTNVDSRY